MIVKIKAYPSEAYKGEYACKRSRVIYIDKCEQIRVNVEGRVKKYVRVPVPSTDESCCHGCHLSSRHEGSIIGICTNVVGCIMHQMHYKEANEMLEEL